MLTKRYMGVSLTAWSSNDSKSNETYVVSMVPRLFKSKRNNENLSFKRKDKKSVKISNEPTIHVNKNTFGLVGL